MVDRPVRAVRGHGELGVGIATRPGHLAAGDDPEVVVFVQCTSPFIGRPIWTRRSAASRWGGGLGLRAVPTYEFLWRSGPDGQASGSTTMPPFGRAPGPGAHTGDRRVLRDVRGGFRDARHRFFGRTSIVPVAELSASRSTPTMIWCWPARSPPALDPRVGVDVDVVITELRRRAHRTPPS